MSHCSSTTAFRIHFTFLSNVIRAGLIDRIISLPATSENAAVILRKKGIVPDVVYADAAHEGEPAYRDCKEYWQLLASEGVLLGDDCIDWEGMTRAANRFAYEAGGWIVGKNGKLVISRNKNVVPEITFT